MCHEIYENIIKPLDLYLNGTCSENEINWSAINWQTREIRREGNEQFYAVRDALKPYYLRFIQADEAFFLHRNTDCQVRYCIIKLLVGEGRSFCREYNTLDIVQCAENWGRQLMVDNHKPFIFNDIMNTLMNHGYAPDWDDIYNQIKHKLARARSYGNFKTHEMLCLLMGITMIMRTSLAEEHKKAFISQLQNQWEFLRYMYSVMIHYIVGLKSDNFASVAFTMSNRKTSYPYMHLFYKAFKDNFDTLCPEGLIDRRSGVPVRKLAQKHIASIEEVIKHTKPSDDLTALCEILFPKRMKAVLEQARPKTYEELEHDIDRLTGNYDAMVKRLADKIKPSVSIDELIAAFMRFPVDLAIAFFNSINSLLVQNETWIKYAPKIQRQILSRQAATNVSIINQFGPVNGNVQQQSLQLPEQKPKPPKQIE